MTLTLDRYRFLSFEEAAAPTQTRGVFYELRQDDYWIVHPEHGLAFFHRKGSLHPQSQRSEEIQRAVLRTTAPDLGFEVRKIERAYLPVDVGHPNDFRYVLPTPRSTS